jgi:hypothetical protein
MKKSKPISIAQQYPQAILAADDVDDPYEKGAKLRVVRNVKEHTISLLHHLNRIDDAQRFAAMEFCRRFEQASIGQQRAIDYSRVRVDGGMLAEPLSERTQEAVEWLKECSRYVGSRAWPILISVAGEGRGLNEVASLHYNAGCPKGRAGDGYILALLKVGLDAVLDFQNWGGSKWKRG